MPDWLSPIISVLLGGVTGIAGNLVTEAFGIWKVKLEHEQERIRAESRLKEREADLREMEAEHRIKVEEGRIRNEGLQIEADGRAFEASHLSDAASYLAAYTGKLKFVQIMLAIVDAMRGVVRPALTGYLAWEVHALRSEVQAVLLQANLMAMSADKALAVYNDAVQMTLFLASTAVTWWFGSRSRAPQGKAVPA